jgi:hypothetical protein
VNIIEWLTRLFKPKGGFQMADMMNEAPVDAPVEAPVDAPVDAPVEEPVEAPMEAPVDAPVEMAQAAPLTLDEMLVNGGQNIQTGLSALRTNRSAGQDAAETLLAAESLVKHVNEDGGEIARSLGLSIDRQIANLENLKTTLGL